jgi:hypothetical protein
MICQPLSERHRAEPARRMSIGRSADFVRDRNVDGVAFREELPRDAPSKPDFDCRPPAALRPLRRLLEGSGMVPQSQLFGSWLCEGDCNPVDSNGEIGL